MTNIGRCPSGRAAAADAVEPSSTVSSKAGIPNAVANLRENADALHQWLGTFDEHVRQASDPLFGRGYGIEEKVDDLFRVTCRLAASIGKGLRDAASAIEAATAGETSTQIEGSTEGESAVAESQTPNNSRTTP